MNFCKNCEHFCLITTSNSVPIPQHINKEICRRKSSVSEDLVTGVKQGKGDRSARTERRTNDPYHCGEVGRFFQPKRKNTLERFTNVLSNSVHKILSFLWNR